MSHRESEYREHAARAAAQVPGARFVVRCGSGTTAHVTAREARAKIEEAIEGFDDNVTLRLASDWRRFDGANAADRKMYEE